jgi:hypothetical protein
MTPPLIHELAIERPEQQVVIGVPQYDDYNQPVVEYVSVTEEVHGFISPKDARELFDRGQAQTADTTIFLPFDTDLTGADQIHYIATGDAYEVVGVKKFDFGRSPHLEVDARLVTAVPTPVEA